MPVALARVALRRTLTAFAIAAHAAARAVLQCPTGAPIVTDTSSDPDVMTYMSQCAAKARPGRLCYARLPASCPPEDPTYTFQSAMSLTRHSFLQQPGRPGPDRKSTNCERATLAAAAYCQQTCVDVAWRVPGTAARSFFDAAMAACMFAIAALALPLVRNETNDGIRAQFCTVTPQLHHVHGVDSAAQLSVRSATRAPSGHHS